MLSFTARRIAAALGTLLLSSLLVFLAVQALPGDVATQVLGKDATPQAVAELRGSLGLDRPAVERYGDWMWGALHGDFGTSLVSGTAVGGEVTQYLGNSMLIAALTILFAVTGSLLLGILAGLYRDRWPDHLISTVSLVGMSVPEFVVATVLVLCFSVALPWFPAVVLYGPDATVGQLLPAVWLPALALAVVMAAYIVRMARTSVIDVMASEYVTTARLKGLSTWRVVTRHALPSALLPVLHVIALNVAWLLGGVAVVENVFNYPGIGKLMLSSVQNRDLPVIQAIALISAVVYVVCNLAADLGAMALNPRLRTRGRTR
ncbi:MULTISPECIES: ABC transporter permease [Streptomyces]|uniref:ABC transporter permease n=1 Tax=Streptomyces koelreuteriae TaxID=2838015 RepID=A0ABX8G2A7_9ACTN|nr:MULTISPECIES: ABC transporter permease [Streptomyces]QWB27649.1 ABC transporter permease [Streptomyces koelreuteriae]UUA10745.1 ABC transporter permease [Streptomyces koelreuteriae]UUA18352.1 ABC transporter permease [Streptomyces sp. CRCS-T-1]